MSGETQPAGGARPRVCIGILTLNRAWSLPKVLEALLGFTYDKKLTGVIFADGGSTDGTLEIVDGFTKQNEERFESIRVIVGGPGISKARNLCIQQARGSDYLLFLDSDVVAGPETIERLLAHFGGNDVGVASLPYDSENSRGKLGVLVRAFNTPTGPAEANKVAAGCTLLSMDMVRKVGSFNENLRVLEDGEYCYRAREEGYRIICDFGYPAQHLKRIQMDSASYLGFVSDSADFYLELAARGSRLYIARYLLSAASLASLVALLVMPEAVPLLVFAVVAVASVVVNSSNRLWGDGSTIKLRYRALVGAVFSLATFLITIASLRPLARRLFRPAGRRAPR
jgi:glycosyltransferase involved in cell wall biosynthesis